MPSPDLEKLDPSDELMGHGDSEEWLQFMGEKMVPTVAEALGVEPYNPETHTGFGCFACHRRVEN